ncbi:UDP-glucuronic acid decarboxylase family protein [Thermococcus radiotolerans]|nr:UDP-glucuronic acid decarboxylase family protein [Thermococcus radiotolerans]
MIKEDVKEITRETKDAEFGGKTVLVTGSAGFLGSWLCEALIEKGATVYCVDNFASGLWENISHLEGNENFMFIEHDVSKLLTINEKIDFIFHFASRASPFEFEHYPLEIIDSNTLGTRNMLELARRYNARFVFASTSEIYGQPKVVPTPERYWGYVNPIGIRSCYDESKRLGEAVTMAYYRQYGVDTKIVRIFNTYGPRMRADGIYGRVVPRFITQALAGKPITVFGEGDQTRSFCYVTDLITGVIKLAIAENAKGEVVNMGNPREITILELAHIIKRLTNSDSPIEFHPLPPDDPQRRCPDITKAKKLLGWEPKVKLEDGLKRTIEWFRARRHRE